MTTEWKTARDWRREGWKVLFRSGSVFLINEVGKVWHTEIFGGKWMEHPNLDDGFWGSAALTSDMKETLRFCYCSSLPDTGCDFCQGCRKAPPLSR